MSKNKQIVFNFDKYKPKRIFIRGHLYNKYVRSRYDDLISILIKNNITPEEARSLIIKNKFETNARYFWTMERINIYLFYRWVELSNFFYNNMSEETLSNHAGYAAEYEKQKNSEDLEKMIKFFNEPVTINYRIIVEAKKNNKIFNKRVNTCRIVVQSIEFKEGYNSYVTNKKFDERLEVQNLQKLVSEKKHSNKFVVKYWRMYDKTSDPKIRDTYFSGKETQAMGLYRVFKRCLTQRTINFIK